MQRLHLSKLHPPLLTVTVFDDDNSLRCRFDAVCDDLTRMHAESAICAMHLALQPSVCRQAASRFSHDIPASTRWQVANTIARGSSVIGKTPMLTQRHTSILRGR
jgi:hypothetical protein